MPDIFVSTKNQSSPPETAKAEKEVIDPPLSNEKPLRLLTSFCLNPLSVKLSDLDSDERIILFLRRHLITNFIWVVEGIVLLFLPFLIIFLSGFFDFQTNFLPFNYYIFAILFYYAMVFQFFFLNFLNWFFNISLVTKRRVLDIDFKILFSKNVASTKIAQIEDVSLNQVGLIRAVFDYGDILVQTAGTEDNFDFEAVPHPERVVHIVGDLIGERQHV